VALAHAWCKDANLSLGLGFVGGRWGSSIPKFRSSNTPFLALWIDAVKRCIIPWFAKRCKKALATSKFCRALATLWRGGAASSLLNWRVDIKQHAFGAETAVQPTIGTRSLVHGMRIVYFACPQMMVIGEETAISTSNSTNRRFFWKVRLVTAIKQNVAR